MKSIFADFVSLIYPRTCFYCNDSLTTAEEHLCLKCEMDLPKYSGQTKKGDLMNKFAHLPKVQSANAYLTYIKSGVAQKLIHGVKYKDKKELGLWLGKKFAQEVLCQEIGAEVILPVPIHRKRRVERGYNQSEIISQGISDALDIPLCVDALTRTEHRQSQTKKGKIERWQNLNSSFSVTSPDTVCGKFVLIFDDVITTGATLGNLCEEVSKHEPKSIAIAALAAGK